MRIDSNQHFWRYSSAEYPWIPAGTPLERDWLPADLESLQRPLNFDGSVAVQARQSIAESDWLLGLADAAPRILGVVGWVDLRSAQVGRDLERLARHPRFVGVRHVVQDEPDDAFLLRSDFLRGIALLKDFGLTYDLLVYPRQLPAAIRLVERFPSQPFVLDHIAKPFIKAGTLEPWASLVRQLATFPNLVCKISGMVTEADHQHWQTSDFTPFLDLVIDAFGPSRLMFGSDWPVCRLAASYEQVEGLVRDRVRGWSPAEQAAFWGGNCARFYGLG
jgi:L-fuconolactonase